MYLLVRRIWCTSRGAPPRYRICASPRPFMYRRVGYASPIAYISGCLVCLVYGREASKHRTRRSPCSWSLSCSSCSPPPCPRQLRPRCAPQRIACASACPRDPPSSVRLRPIVRKQIKPMGPSLSKAGARHLPGHQGPHAFDDATRPALPESRDDNSSTTWTV